MQQRDTLNPFNGKRGFWAWLNRNAYRFTGPAQVGIGRPEAPHVPPTDSRCPLCGEPMSEHRIVRGDATMRTMLTCPKPPLAG